jgi:DNA-binding transcriptional LysR family regulator
VKFSAPNLWHLTVFSETVARGSVTAAADALGLTQPAASQALKNLAGFYAAPLTERRNDSIVVTEEGAILLNRASAALALLSEGLKEAAGARNNAMQMLRAMSARRLETLVSIVRHGGFANAARADGYAAPTVHRAAKDLERALGVTLFEATSHGVKPTKRADALALKASLAFAELRQAQAEIASRLGREAGRTVIGAMPLARAHLVPVAVSAFCSAHPDHRVSIVEGSYEDLLISLRRGEADLLVGALRDNAAVRDVVEEPLFDDELAVVMRKGHPVADARKLDGATLAAFPWIAARQSAPLRGHFDSLFRDLDMPPPLDVIECNSLGASRVMLMNSDRLMLLSDEQILYEKASGMLVSRPHPAGRVVRTIGLTIRRAWRPTLVQAVLVDRIRAAAKEISGSRR